MKRFVEGENRNQSTLFPELLDDYVDENNPVRVIEAFIDDVISATSASRVLSPTRPAGLPIILASC